MNIEETEISDLGLVVDLVTRVSSANILPHFNEQGQVTFASKILPDVETAFDKTRFQNLKATKDNELVGFGAIRDKEYITHLFVDVNYQGSGLGKLLMKHMLALSTGREVRLRASVNAVNFYKSQGFVATGSELEVSGIRFVPMVWVRT
ncbi:GNAT family N-acetyltransferase [Vibrio parahaemolyticus]|uniref:GNAT family N-acetyltransferase n=1 Tax=Vibrio parahaemolyticus TaxID=670 RepID=UPI001122E223|nr:GNAT family N-acetyltransferase [Vibrio parahaemolyticus]EGQ8195906.1 GNAT family N-acetyltransferase [Vibrio parahaemolyticus]TOB18884.1 GNAT family N-acetyltransferase [Vibrio parahaemolyticus]TOI76082.1 GNAT family N-acetyltransferase [Vibrio parahaemolyticus]TOL07348.1 GNAT family N-acetyltransferase [Vibrio parahaemolyticus]TOO91792.1 GNAT family N-acetyltransferase [Vibrio parahaemolyticus]